MILLSLFGTLIASTVSETELQGELQEQSITLTPHTQLPGHFSEPRYQVASAAGRIARY